MDDVLLGMAACSRPACYPRAIVLSASRACGVHWSSAATCVQEAVTGSTVLLRRPDEPARCLQSLGSGRRAASAACNASDASQGWTFHSRTSTFRLASDTGLCLDVFSADYDELGVTSSAGGDATGGDRLSRLHHPTEALDSDLEHERRTIDAGGALGSWPCVSRAPNERFVYDRYMGRYCSSYSPAVCVMEAVVGTPLRLRLPSALTCLQVDDTLAMLQERQCNATELRQQWAYDDATLVFRFAADRSAATE